WGGRGGGRRGGSRGRRWAGARRGLARWILRPIGGGDRSAGRRLPRRGQRLRAVGVLAGKADRADARGDGNRDEESPEPGSKPHGRRETLTFGGCLSCVRLG